MEHKNILDYLPKNPKEKEEFWKKREDDQQKLIYSIGQRIKNMKEKFAENQEKIKELKIQLEQKKEEYNDATRQMRYCDEIRNNIKRKKEWNDHKINQLKKQKNDIITEKIIPIQHKLRQRDVMIRCVYGYTISSAQLSDYSNDQIDEILQKKINPIDIQIGQLNDEIKKIEEQIDKPTKELLKIDWIEKVKEIVRNFDGIKNSIECLEKDSNDDMIKNMENVLKMEMSRVRYEKYLCEKTNIIKGLRDEYWWGTKKVYRSLSDQHLEPSERLEELEQLIAICSRHYDSHPHSNN
jgi:hypothetical protein